MISDLKYLLKMNASIKLHKNLSSLILLILLSGNWLMAQNINEQAQNAYQEGDYSKAIELYKREIDEHQKQGKISAQLYFNLGNAYFRNNDIPEAILNYERASLFDPSDSDIKHNIEYAQSRIEDKIPVVDSFFLTTWFGYVQNLLSSNSWAILSIFLFIFLILSLTLYFFSRRITLKKIGFYGALVFIILVTFTNIFAINQRSRIENRNTGIIMVGSVPVLGSPSNSSKELFVLHEGSKVTITRYDGPWIEIKIGDGSVGWIQKNKIEII